VLESVLQTEDEARQELATLFSNPAEVDAWIGRMPLRLPESEPAHAEGHARSVEKQAG